MKPKPNLKISSSGMVLQPTSQVEKRREATKPAAGRPRALTPRPSGAQDTPQWRIQLHVQPHTTTHRHHGGYV